MQIATAYEFCDGRDSLKAIVDCPLVLRDSDVTIAVQNMLCEGVQSLEWVRQVDARMPVLVAPMIRWTGTETKTILAL